MLTVMDGVKFEFNDILKMILREEGQSAYDVIKLSIFDDIIVNKATFSLIFVISNKKCVCF